MFTLWCSAPKKLLPVTEKPKTRCQLVTGENGEIREFEGGMLNDCY